MTTWRVAGLTYRASRGKWSQTYDLQPLGYPEGSIWIGWPGPEPHAAQWDGSSLQDRTYTGMRAGKGVLYSDTVGRYVWHVADPHIVEDSGEQWKFDRLPFDSQGPWEHYDPPIIPRDTSWDSRGPWILDGYIYVGQIELNQDWMPFHAGRGKLLRRRAVSALVTDPWETVLQNYHGFFYSNNAASMGKTAAGLYLAPGAREQGPTDSVLISSGGAVWDDPEPTVGFSEPINSFVYPVEVDGALVFVHMDTGSGAGLNYSADGRSWTNFKPTIFANPSEKGVELLATDGHVVAYGNAAVTPTFGFGPLGEDWQVPPTWDGQRVGALYFDRIMGGFCAGHAGHMTVFDPIFASRYDVDLATVTSLIPSYIIRLAGTEGWPATGTP